jgi:signal peptidase I
MSNASVLVPVAGCAVAAAAGALLWVRHTYLLVTIQGASMEPTYHAGEQVVVRRKPPRQVRRSEVAVLLDLESVRGNWPDEVGLRVRKRSVLGQLTWPCMIKRVVAVPGDPLPREQVPALRDAPESFVPPGKVVLLGDNAAASYDSREHGYFSAENLVGTVVRRLPAGTRSSNGYAG